jgi:hypothetical protein
MRKRELLFSWHNATSERTGSVIFKNDCISTTENNVIVCGADKCGGSAIS